MGVFMTSLLNNCDIICPSILSIPSCVSTWPEHLACHITHIHLGSYRFQLRTHTLSLGLKSLPAFPMPENNIFIISSIFSMSTSSMPDLDVSTGLKDLVPAATAALICSMICSMVKFSAGALGIVGEGSATEAALGVVCVCSLPDGGPNPGIEDRPLTNSCKVLIIGSAWSVPTEPSPRPLDSSAINVCSSAANLAGSCIICASRAEPGSEEQRIIT
jgi:hypothetical protein